MTDMNLISNKATLEGYAIHRLEAYRKEVAMLQDQIREQKELLDEQGEVLQVLDHYMEMTSSGEFIGMEYIPVDSRDAKIVANCFGLNLKRRETNDQG